MCAQRMRGSGYSIYQGKLIEMLEYSYTEHGQSLELAALLHFRIFVLGNAQNLTGQDPEVTDLTLELALL